MRIEGKLAAVLSEYEVAFNIGSDQGVADNAIATVSQDVEVRDPDTEDVLGRVLVPRMRFKMRFVEPRMCVGYSYEFVWRDPVDGGLAFVRILSPRAIRRVARRPDEESWAAVYLRPGDPAVIEVPQKQIPQKQMPNAKKRARMIQDDEKDWGEAPGS